MKVPNIALQFVKCAKCQCFLSRGPVYMQPYGVSVCSKCFNPNSPGGRITCYEAIAKLFKFPCKNVKFGCRASVPFVGYKKLIPHEEVCPYRRYVCLLLEENCTWFGVKTDILQHCLQKHKPKVYDNPVLLLYDVNNFSFNTYLIRAFDELFVLYVKISVSERKIYHTIRFLGSTEKTKKFEYILIIQRKHNQVTKIGYVEPQGNLDMNEKTALIVTTSEVLRILGSWKDTLVMIALHQNVNSSKNACVSCHNELSSMSYRNDIGWCCNLCSPSKVICENRDCYYEDYPKKCDKHALHYCNERLVCQICCKKKINGSWFVHYHTAHRNITYSSGELWRVHYGASTYCLLRTVAGTAVCWSKLLDTSFTLYVYIPPIGELLYEFSCEVKIIQPETGNQRIYTPMITFKKTCDWFVTITSNTFKSWYNQLDVSVTISRIVNNRDFY